MDSHPLIGKEFQAEYQRKTSVLDDLGMRFNNQISRITFPTFEIPINGLTVVVYFDEMFVHYHEYPREIHMRGRTWATGTAMLIVYQ